MAREIKFRAWDTIRKVMFSAREMGADQEALLPDGRGFANISSTSTRLTEIHSHLLPLQFTGLLDKKGKEIYEGDILRLEEDERFRGKVWFNPQKLAWAYDELGLTEVVDFNLEVIGNIYQNPELLEGK